MNKITILAIIVLLLIGLCMYMCQIKTKQIMEEETKFDGTQKLLPKSFDNQREDDPVFDPEVVHEFDSELKLI